MTVKFAGKEYPNNMTVEELCKTLQVENAVVVRYEKQKQKTAQELLEEC